MDKQKPKIKWLLNKPKSETENETTGKNVPLNSGFKKAGRNRPRIYPKSRPRPRLMVRGRPKILKSRKKAKIHRTLRGRVTKRKNQMPKTHEIGTQVSFLGIYKTFESLCDKPMDLFATYKENLLKRKLSKYKNLILKSSIGNMSRETLKLPVAYDFGPITIHKIRKPRAPLPIFRRCIPERVKKVHN